MSAQPVDVLAAIHDGAERLRSKGCTEFARDLDEAIEIVAELIGADREYDAALARSIEAANRITGGDRSDEAFVRQANAGHAYDRAVDRRRAALARIGDGK